MTREEQIKEAIMRMKELNLHENVVREFKEENMLNMSENGGFLYWLSEEHNKIIRDWEEESGNVAYHIIHNHTEFGELLSILYVGKYEDEWEMERADIKDGHVFSYVVNLDVPEFSEYGSIAIQRKIGGLVRVG